MTCKHCGKYIDYQCKGENLHTGYCWCCWFAWFRFIVIDKDK